MNELDKLIFWKDVSVQSAPGNLRRALSKGLEGKTLVAAANVEEPFTYPCIFGNYSADGVPKNCSSANKPGVSYDVFKFLATLFKFNFTLVQPEDHQFGGLREDGNWSGLVGMVGNGEADITLSPLSYSYDRGQAMAYSFPIMFLRKAYLIKNPGSSSNINIFLLPFNRTVWLLLLASCFCVIVLLTGIRILFREGQPLTTPWATLWTVYNSIVQQKFEVSSQLSSRLISVIWLLMLVCLTAVYTGNLTGYFAIRVARLPFTDLNTLSEQLARGRYRIITETVDDSFFSLVKRSQDPVYTTIRNAIKKYPPILVEDTDTALRQLVKRSDLVFLSTEARLRLIAADANVTGGCENVFIIVDRTTEPKWQGLGFPKNSPYVQNFNTALYHMRDMIEHMMEHYHNSLGACSAQAAVESSVSHEAMSLDDMDELLIACGFIFTLATAFLFAEQLPRRIKAMFAHKNR